MDDKILIYDLEIKRAIPPKSPADRLEGIEYCEDWNDFENMGIACISFALLDVKSLQIDCCSAGMWNSQVRHQLHKILEDPGIRIGGFNTKRFDDELLAANGVFLNSDIDVFECVLDAAGVLGTEYWEKGLKYNLDSIAAANHLSKIGAGADAPILYQKGEYGELQHYCLTDTLIAADILILLMKGSLYDPNSMNLLELPEKYQN